MKIFHSELTTKSALRYKRLHQEKPLRGLISYAVRDKNARDLLIKHRDKLDSLILDSGTYTLNSDPKRYEKIITFEGYKSYLKVLAKDKIDFYFNFDSDFSKDGFETNYGYQLDLEKAGFNPVPVIHDCYGDEVKLYIDRGYEMVAIGSGELKYAGLDDLRHIVDQFYRNGVKVHFLGCTEYRKLAYLPVYSADSSTWNRNGTAGKIFYWNPLKSGYNKLDKITVTDNVPKRCVQHHINNYKFRKQLEDYLYTELRLSVDDLMMEDRHINRALVNIHYFVLLEELINQKHQEQGFNIE